ncbi:putative nitrate ABC transporter, periplasmic protein [Sphaerisporangium siamense]|uniref:NitT/TauT family transport system substrate-binding protein n=1 Tax=Sphaerisporangium siamense TaxID=795645 RepID=A0A7W7DHE2_9ACTN|nr:ABC transporter substrate-binding protein [Sphaerisporangium siamense]MBB4705801.1 NitT/TauT family transport system substrate-binding protein [Sphaerisporangium siamense]GII82811.1 putative nitrate ABC transporter, periplasmic protein [Sphaerisporangium siamense]
MRARIRAAAAALAAVAFLPGCSVAGNASSSDKITVVVGYQSKTINTVTAGTLLRSLGYLERRLGPKYRVEWQDHDTGAPITAKMVAGKIDIGSMGDYPLLINASRTQSAEPARTALVSVTGYNLRGGLNMVVVAPGSRATTLADLKGGKVSASVGSAGHGTLVQALRRAGIDGVETVNQQPPVGASALQAGDVAAYAQFVAWPGLLVFKGQARLLYDGSALGVPTFHGVVVRRAYAGERPEVVRAFLGAQIDATRYLHEHPLEAAQTVAKATGLPAEVVYLYNGPNGIATFDVTLKPRLVEALRNDVPYLASIGGDFKPVEVSRFADDSFLRAAYGPSYGADVAATANPARITGADSACGVPVNDAGTAGELWVSGTATRPAATPTCLLRQIRALGGTYRAAYVPDAATGTRWFADKAVWVRDPARDATARFLPFTTAAGAGEYVSRHDGARVVDFRTALKEA